MVQIYDSPSGKGMCAACTEDIGPCEGYPCVNAPARASTSHVIGLIQRLHQSCTQVERECMGLHLALIEACRRLKDAGQDASDLLKVLDNPANAPVNWEHERARKLPRRTKAQLADDYQRIFGRER